MDTNRTHTDHSKKIKLLLFGGTGKLGRQMLSQGLAGFQVFSPSRQECDITNLGDVHAIFKKIQPQVVINTAALVGSKECEDHKELAWSVNVIGAANIAKACAEYNARLVFLSSAAIFDGKKGRYTETEPPTPTYYYAVTKVAAEQAVGMLQDHAIVRLDFFPLANLKYANVLSDHYTSKISITETAAKVIQIASSNFVGVINIGQERDSLYNILKPYYPHIQPIKLKDSPLPNFPRDISLDLTKWRANFSD